MTVKIQYLYTKRNRGKTHKSNTAEVNPPSGMQTRPRDQEGDTWADMILFGRERESCSSH